MPWRGCSRRAPPHFRGRRSSACPSRSTTKFSTAPPCCTAAYVYASCGVWESTTDVVFGGHCLIAENGTLLAESKRIQRAPALLVADVDLDRLRADRIRTNSFGDASLYSGPRRDFVRVE